MIQVRIKGTGIYAPGEPIGTKELMELTGTEFNGEKIENKVGVKTRHIAHLRGIEETTADFAFNAAMDALEDAGILADELDLIVVASDTPEYISPSTAMILQGRLQKKESWTTSIDINAACASFPIALDNAIKQMHADPSMKYALVTGVYNMPAYIRPGDAFGYSIFADGAGAFVLERSDDEKSGYICNQNLTDGTQWDYIGVYAGGTKIPVTKALIDKEEQGLLSLQRLPGDRNVRLWPMMIEKLMAKSGTKVDDVDHFLFTQINKSVIHEVMDILGQDQRKTTTIMDRYGYTGSGCIPMAFHHALKSGSIKRGDRVAMVASGAGLAVGSLLIQY